MHRRALLALLMAFGGLVPILPAAAAPAPEVVVSGLNNPRQVSFGPQGTLVVAEAGRGGTRCNEAGCWGLTGSVSVVRRPATTANARPHRVARGFLSVAAPGGAFAVGSNGACGTRTALKVAMGFAPPPQAVPDGLPSRQLGKLLSANLVTGDVRMQANISAVEFALDPDGQGNEPDARSNPYSVLCLGRRYIVADAAGNDLIEVRGRRARVLTVFPNHHGVDSVPTSIALGGDGHIYVGELAGEGKPGVARVYKLNRRGKILDWVGGFTAVHGVDVHRNGTMYVSQLFGGPQGFGRLTKVMPDGRRRHAEVPLPGGVAVHHRNVYVAAWSISDADGADVDGFQLQPGQVWRLRW
jgi:hypothetical protein